MERAEVREFVIVPPEEKAPAVVLFHERFKAYLAMKFPGYVFTLQKSSPVDDESFQVIPVMGKVGDGGFMCNYPDPLLVRAIRAACDAFDPASSQGLAA
jgi:hypothetical protein